MQHAVHSDSGSVWKENKIRTRKTHTVHIFVNEATYSSPSVTTGEELYAIANVHTGLELFREVSGDEPDLPVPRGADAVHLKENDHFHSGRRSSRSSSTGARRWLPSEGSPLRKWLHWRSTRCRPGPMSCLPITYRRGPKQNPEGTLVEGGTVKVKDGMIFNVTPTDKS